MVFGLVLSGDAGLLPLRSPEFQHRLPLLADVFIVLLSSLAIFYRHMNVAVLRVAATSHDKRLFFKVVCCLYVLSVIGPSVSGVTVAYIGLCLFCLYKVENSQTSNIYQPIFSGGRDDRSSLQDNN